MRMKTFLGCNKNVINIYKNKKSKITLNVYIRNAKFMVLNWVFLAILNLSGTVDPSKNFCNFNPHTVAITFCF